MRRAVGGDGRRRWCSAVQASGTNITRIQDLAGATFEAQLQSAPVTEAISLGTGTYAFSNFNTVFNGVRSGFGTTRRGLIGSGIGNTILQMTASTSTRSGEVPTAAGTTNQLYLGYFEQDNLLLKCFTVQGTSQGHLYNGFRLHGVNGGSFSNIKMIGASPGNNNIPPGETFAFNEYQGGGNHYEQMEIDGDNTGATGFGANNYAGATYVDCYAHDHPYSAGWALWQGTGVSNLIRCRSNENRTAFNIERIGMEAIGQARGTVNLIDCTFGNIKVGGQDIFLGNDQGSTILNIYDPIGRNASNKIKIFYPALEQTHTNIQSQSDVHVWVGGTWTGTPGFGGTYSGGTDVAATWIDYSPFG